MIWKHVIALAFVALVGGACAPSAPALVGTELDRSAAPDFTLVDSLTGRSLTLSSLHGKAVALTFLYTQCPDSCPLTAELLRAARDKLGADATRVALVAVSVDPQRDTPQAVRAFSEAHQLSEGWHYLGGRSEQLAPVWSAYGVRAAGDQGKSTVTHSDAIYLIDPRGRERALVHTNESPEALARSFRTLLGER